MVIENNRARDMRIAYIGGGSRGWAWTFMTDLAITRELSGEVVLYDIDHEAARVNEKIGNRLMAREDAVGEWRFLVAESLKEALTGADFVIISILPGTFDEMAVDVHTPERLNVWQSVGDTAGPGGMMRALRTIPMFAEIARAIRDYSPDAWVVNYTNPMSLCVKTLYTIFPEIKAFGCCHEVFGTQQVLAGIYTAQTGREVADWHDVHVDVTGINHFTWFSRATLYGDDLFPIYRSYIDSHFDEGFSAPSDNWLNRVFICRHRVKMDLFLRYGWIAAAGDRHLAEFMPGDEYLADPETVEKWDFCLTSVDWRREDLKERLERSRRLAAGEEDIDLKTPTGEEGILLIKALCGLGRVISNVNIPNAALQIPNLPAGAVVETNAVFDRGRISPIAAGPIKRDILELLTPHTENHERTMLAALTGDAEPLVKAFLADPNTAAHGPSESDVRALVRDMLDGTKKYLPQEFLQRQ